MNLRSKLLASHFSIIFLAVFVGLLFVVQVRGLERIVTGSFSSFLEELSRVSYLDTIAQSVRYDDEVLTQSARNYAFTGDTKWKERYVLAAKDLDAKLAVAKEKGDVVEKKFFEGIDEANTVLVDMEERSMSLVDQGNRSGAIDILESRNYWDYKKIYNDNLNEYLNERGVQSNGVFLASTDSVKETSHRLNDSIYTILAVFAIGIVVGSLACAILAWRFSFAFVKPILELKSAMHRMASGKFKERLEVKSKDEFGELSYAFNAMADELEESRTNIEKKIAERTAELEKMNAHMIGRELKMIELKERLAALEKEKL